MSNEPLDLSFFIALGKGVIGPIKMGLYTSHTVASLVSTNLDDPLQIPADMRTGLPRTVFWVEGSKFLKDNETYKEQMVKPGDTIILTDLKNDRDNVQLLQAAAKIWLEQSKDREKQEEKQKERESFSVAVATKLRQDLASSGRIPRGVEKGYLFIAMAMLPDDPSLVDVHRTIVRVAKENHLKAERVDDVQTNIAITQRIIESLDRAEYVVVDITHSRPNVFFEAGYAQGIGKLPIYIARSGTHIEFDIKDYPIIFFRNLAELEEQLGKRLSALIESGHIMEKN